MTIFRRKHPDLSRNDALAARPIRAEATVARDDAGGAKVTVALQGGRWTGWLFKTPVGAKKTYELDELGLFVWDACDGKTSVQQVIRKLAKRYNLNLREAEVATVKFLQMLTKRGLIGISLRKDDKVKG
jgi:hypothetical protein